MSLARHFNAFCHLYDTSERAILLSRLAMYFKSISRECTHVKRRKIRLAVRGNVQKIAGSLNDEINVVYIVMRAKVFLIMRKRPLKLSKCNRIANIIKYHKEKTRKSQNIDNVTDNKIIQKF